MKKTLIGALASLMLAGALSAASGMAAKPTNGVLIIVGEGSAPIPLRPSTETEPGDRVSLDQ